MRQAAKSCNGRNHAIRHKKYDNNSTKNIDPACSYDSERKTKKNKRYKAEKRENTRERDVSACFELKIEKEKEKKEKKRRTYADVPSFAVSSSNSSSALLIISWLCEVFGFDAPVLILFFNT